MQNTQIHNTNPTDKTINPGLYIVATPIGNLHDITLRACAILKQADLILCEDTRITRRLLQKYTIKTPLSAYHDHNGAKLRPKILNQLIQGKIIALLSDAGTPLISDPGYKLVREAGNLKIPVHPIPGACAAIAALSAAGIPSQDFLFAGFLPPKRTQKRAFLKKYSDHNTTLIFYDAPNRILATLEDAIEIFGHREGVIAREMTKLYEEIIRTTLPNLYRKLSEKTHLKGEITFLIAPPEKKETITEMPETLKSDDVLKILLNHMPPAKAATQISAQTGIKRKIFYKRAIEIQENTKLNPKENDTDRKKP